MNKLLTEVYIEPHYALKTLINGNYTNCAKYLSELLNCGIVGLMEYTDSMVEIHDYSSRDYNIISYKIEFMSK